jgi:hypothetical protein
MLKSDSEPVSTAPNINGGELYTIPFQMMILGLHARLLGRRNPFHEDPDEQF